MVLSLSKGSRLSLRIIASATSQYNAGRFLTQYIFSKLQSRLFGRALMDMHRGNS
jgi:hypothetical protein